MKVVEFGKLNFDECLKGFDYNLVLCIMNLIFEFDLFDGNVIGGCFFFNEEIFFINFEIDCFEYFIVDGKFLYIFLINFFFDDVCFKNFIMNILYVICFDIFNEYCGVYMVKLLEINEEVMEIFKLLLKKFCYGVIYMFEFLYVVCDDVIIKMNCYGDIVWEF